MVWKLNQQPLFLESAKTKLYLMWVKNSNQNEEDWSEDNIFLGMEKLTH